MILHKYILNADLSHVFLGGEDKLMVYNTAWLLLMQTAVWMYKYTLLLLHCLVPTAAEPGRVVEIASCDSLTENRG